MNQTVLRAIDPETHLPYRHQTVFEKFAALLWEKYGIKALLKGVGKISSFVLILTGAFGYTPTAVQSIGVGMFGLALGVIDFAVSAITRRMGWFPLKSLQVASEEQQEEEYLKDKDQ